MYQDIVVVGAGLVGLATARALHHAFPALRLTVLDKEKDVTAHQSGHNSGVIHAGLYYQPGSLKARLCVQGKGQLERYCAENGVAFERCGKLIVAQAGEEDQLMHLAHRALQNGIHVRVVPREQLREYEPHVAGALGLYSPGTGIADYPALGRALRRELQAAGVEVRTGTELRAVQRKGKTQSLQTSTGEIQTRWVVACAGLHADRVARLCGVRPSVQIVPFRGEYYELHPERRQLVNNLIYPVPNPEFPFLGVHLTRMIHGGVEAGPNAVLALAREGYTHLSVNLRDLGETLRFPGLWQLARKYPTVGIYEYYRSFVKAEFTRSLQRLVPEIQAADLVAGGAGVRAQALRPDGRLVDDFALARGEGSLHVLNAPSPAATACLAIGEYVAAQAAGAFGFTPHTAPLPP